MQILRKELFLAAIAAAVLGGCETSFTTVAPEVSTTARNLGPASGSGYAHILFGTPTYNIIAIGWDGRAGRAYDEALASRPGAAALSGVTLQESWFWWVVGSARKLTIEGDAVVER